MAAGGAVIGALRVVLGADTADFDKGLKGASDSMSKFSIAAAAGAAALATTVAAVAYKVGTSIQGAIENADKLNKLSQSTGLSTEELSKLSYAAELADIPLEALGKSMGKLSKAMVEASTDGASQAARTFTAMGVAIKNQDGTLRSSADVIGDMAGKFEGYRDGAAKTAIAINIFGKAGAAMIPLLNLGKEGLKENADEAERYGLVLSKSTTAAAEAFNDNLKKMDKIKQGVVTTMTAKMLPALEQLSVTLLKSREESTLWNTVGDALANVFNKIAAAGIALITTWQRIFATAADLKTAFGQLATGQFTAAWETMNKSAKETGEAITGVASQIKTLVFPTEIEKFWQNEIVLINATNKAVQEAVKEWAKVEPPKIADAAQKNALDQFLSSQQKSIAAHQADFDATGLAAGAKERLRVVLQALAVAKERDIALSEQDRVKITETANAAEMLGLKLGNLALLGGESNPFVAIGVAIDATKAKLDSGALSAENYAILSGQAAQLTSKLWADSATSLGGSMESIGSSLASLNDGWARAAKVGQAIGATVAFVNSYVAASEAFAKTPFPANVAVAGAVLAKGIAMVAAIKSAAVPKMAMGGAFRVPGGMGGGDKVPFHAMLEPGELVEVSSNRPGGYRSGSAGGGANRIDVSGLGRDGYSRSEVVKIIEGINDAIGDGWQLKVIPT